MNYDVDEYEFISGEEMANKTGTVISLLLDEKQAPYTVAQLRITLLCGDSMTPADRVVYTYLYFKSEFGNLTTYWNSEPKIDMNWFSNVHIPTIASSLNMTVDEVEESLDRLASDWFICLEGKREHNKTEWNRCYSLWRLDGDSAVVPSPLKHLVYRIDLEHYLFEQVAKEELLKVLNCVFQAIETEKLSPGSAYLLILCSVLSTRAGLEFEGRVSENRVFACPESELMSFWEDEDEYRNALDELNRSLLCDHFKGGFFGSDCRYVERDDDTICFFLAYDWLMTYETPEKHKRALKRIESPEMKERMKRFTEQMNK